MTRSLYFWRTAATASAAVAGLVLAGCGGSGSGGSNPPSGTSKPASTQSSTSAGPTSAGSAKSVPFPTAVGDTWTYSTFGSTVAGTTVVDKIVAVTPVSGGQRVTMNSAITSAGTTSSKTGYFIFHPDGSITYPFSQFSSASSAVTVTLVSGEIIWPPAAALAAGQVSHSTLTIKVTAGGQTQTLTAALTVKGDGTKSVTVPAGTYPDATVVDMAISETVEGVAVATDVTVWLAPGVGPVKSQAAVSEGGQSTVAGGQTLTSFTRG